MELVRRSPDQNSASVKQSLNMARHTYMTIKVQNPIMTPSVLPAVDASTLATFLALSNRPEEGDTIEVQNGRIDNSPNPETLLSNDRRYSLRHIH